MIYLYDASARSFCRKDFNKFHVISCLWYGGERARWWKTGAQIYYIKFFKCRFSEKTIVMFLSQVGWGRRWKVMKTVIKTIIMASSWGWLSIVKLSTLRELISAESADVWITRRDNRRWMEKLDNTKCSPHFSTTTARLLMQINCS